MSRIPLVEPENASPEVREIYRKYEADGFPIFNVMKMFANKADFVAGLYIFTHGLYTDAKLSPATGNSPTCALRKSTPVIIEFPRT